MLQTYYMEKVMIILKKGITWSHFLSLVEKLQKEGIAVQAFSTEEELPQEKRALYITDCGKTAIWLKEQGMAVLGYLCEQQEQFGRIDYLMESPEGVDVVYLDRVYRRYYRIPWHILETERCIIRESTIGDVDKFFEIYSQPDIVKYTEGLHPTKEQEIAYIQEYIDRVYRYFEFGVWTILCKETEEIIGRAGFSVREGYELPELGFVIDVPWQGKGIAYEICNAMLQYGKEEYGFEKVQTLVMPENIASLALCHKLGFTEQESVMEKEKEYLLLECVCSEDINLH